VYGGIIVIVIGVQMAFGVWAARYIAAQRLGASMRLWTIIGVVAGFAAPALAWEFAGWRAGQSGLQEMRRQRGR